MPTKVEKDSVTGHMTTGHEWDGLKELNRPLPKWWIYVFSATVVWSLGYVIAYPSFSWFTGYSHGVLGYSTRARVDADVAALQMQRACTMDKIKAASFDQIRKDPQLQAAAQVAGRITFANNCQPCHGAGGGGAPGYPALAAGNWLWGGKLEDIQQTITFGIRSGHDNARVSQMPKFGVDGVLKADEIGSVADYVMTLYGAGPGKDVSKGKVLFGDNCAVCHGENGVGNREVGGPKLASKVHLYANTRDEVIAQVSNPRQGVMPNWNLRLDEATIKSVALYVHSLGGGE